ncbi:putative PPE family protein PPE29 [Mycobacterium kansasii]|uniref:Ribulose-phosphate 3-epimerase n=4 Tax=Mycobacterium kansasii TaxID=1768 RepID=U5WSG7_MYCKA|nr:ribulose-phosphate 3-epimerase [Mycobacterium kansasii ATCC 12478]KEP44117.1 ribulose-phosphate 3-epimerase [Mycobacterium kansasii]VAZ58626.1 putative PPE family protein PPE29 [Mycobacterium kansasii]VAZ65022.1 putative PPE family protein PPE29 [Mycobacterium kansasii]VAZ71858.1 putative PPE family protein PPE29 [Mycobacterium kansasii]
MTIDFGALPPEINSGRMYIGPGSGPMLAAAAAWDSLAAGLHSTAASYSSVISGLTAGWQGPASITMAAAAAPYTAWINATAAQAEQTATQARVAAVAFETAFAATVPPPAVTANRAQLMALIATNFFGQNTPAIMGTQAEYIEMWAQDAAAMYGYAGSSATASQVTPFSEPPQIANPAGTEWQAAAVARATSAVAGMQTMSLPQLMSGVPSSLQSLAAPGSSTALAAAADPTAPASLASSLNTIISTITGPSSALSLFTIAGVPYLLGIQSYLLPQNVANVANAASKVSAASASSGGWVGVGSAGGGLSSAASAGMGRAGLVGGLSVPQGWAMSAPAVKPVAAVFAENGLTGAPAAAATQGEGSLFSNMALSGLAGRAMVPTGGTAARSSGATGGATAGEASGPVNIFIVPAGAQ